MKSFKLITMVAAALAALALNSCCQSCCTGVTPDEPLKPLPSFMPLHPGK